MNKKAILQLFLLSLLVITALYLGFRAFRQPTRWTGQNSLRPAAAPVLADNGEVASLLTAINFSLEYYDRLPPTRTVSFGKEIFTIQQVKDSLVDFRDKLMETGLSDVFFTYVRENFNFYRSGSRRVLFTGYYEASLKGSLTYSETYRWPLYKKPDDLYLIKLSEFPFYAGLKDKTGLPPVLRGRLANEGEKTIVPYYSREEIDGSAKLGGKSFEIVWIDNPVDVFFLQIQGSGVVELDSGATLRVNYAEANGHPYRAIGRLLLERGDVPRDKLSMRGIREYLEEHPEEMEEIFNYNPSYVFFRVVDRGPLGFIEVPLTPSRSIALDSALFPRGGLCYIDTELPEFDEKNELSGWRKFQGFVMHQDTGGAIRTPGRVDFFTGRGGQAELTAGHLKRDGMFYFLIKKGVSVAPTH